MSSIMIFEDNPVFDIIIIHYMDADDKRRT